MHSRQRARRRTGRLGYRLALVMILVIALGTWATPITPASAATTLVEAHFDTGTDGFTYIDDPFLGTSQPSYASGTRSGSGGYGGSGGLTIALGGIDASAVTGMSGGWRGVVSLSSAQTGVAVSFRYRVTQTATYEHDEHSRFLVDVDGTLYGRGGRAYVDHIAGDGSSGQGNSSTFQPSTEWQQHEVFVGALAAGTHHVTLGGFSNRKDAADESTSIAIDDVVISADNAPPLTDDAAVLVERLSLSQFKANIQTLSGFGDRCRMSGCSPYTSYNNALNWVEGQLTVMGYSPVRSSFTYSGFSGTNLYATKVGTLHPDRMYMISAHLDGRGGGGGADDDGSGVSLVLEAARQFAASDVSTDASVRFIFWDNEESGLYGAYGYVADRRSLQGQESPAGSGQYPEPTWLGIVQHDMVLYDHGVGTPGSSQSAYADLDVEWRAGTAKETDSKALATTWHFAAGEHAGDYPSTAYDYSTNTDDTPFHPYTAAVSVRENRRSLTSGGNAEWINPHYHTSNDVYASYSEADFALGLNAVEATLGTVAELAGAVVANQPPAAVPDTVVTVRDAAVGFTLTATDDDGDPLTYRVTAAPVHGTLSGTAPDLTYTPSASYAGEDTLAFVASDGRAESAPATVRLVVGLPLPFADDFESDRGWVVDPGATDSARSGQWVRGRPEATFDDGPKQLGTPVSGSYDLVTGPRAGRNANADDVDGGVTSIRSPALFVPVGKDVTLGFSYYLAHARNASDHDFLRVTIVGTESTGVVLDVRATRADVDAEWRSTSVPLAAFAGQVVYARIEAADGHGNNLVEAAVDDLAISVADPSGPLLAATFASGTDTFAYGDDTFRGTSQPGYASGERAADGGHDGGALRVLLGGIDVEVVEGMSGGWQRTFSLPAATAATVSCWVRLTQSPDYESEESSEALLAIDGVLVGEAPGDAIARLSGNGNGGDVESTGWRLFSADLGVLGAGQHTLTIGGYNDRKSWDNEWTEVLFDDVIVAPAPGGP